MATNNNVVQGAVAAEDIEKSVKDALESVSVLASHEAITQGSNSKGISLLEVKNRMMAQYLQDLTLVIHKKLGAQSIKDHPAVWRLIENRTFMEKLLFIEQKLQYEINKLVKKHHFGEAAEPDGLKFKPNVDNFDVGSDDEDNSDEEITSEDEEMEEKEAGKKKVDKEKDGVYRPPRVAPMPYTGDETVEDKEKKVKKRALSNALLADLRSELLDEPEEIVDSADLHRHRADRQRKERQEYEEKYFVRTSMSKKEKTKSRQMATVYGLDGLAKFDSFFGDEETDGPPSKKRRSSKGFKGKGKGKKGKGKKIKRH